MRYGIRKGIRERRRSTHLFMLLVLITVFAACAAWFLWRTGESVYRYFTRAARYDRIIRNAGLRNRIDPALVKAVIWRESRFDRSARGLKGEIGLMQIMPGPGFAAEDWARAHRAKIPECGVLYDPELNIEIGSWYLSRAMHRYWHYKDSVALALCEYNAGPGRAASWKPEKYNDPVIDRITIPSTKQYVKEILQQYEYDKQQEKQPGKKGKK